MPKPDFKTEWESDTYDKAFAAMETLLNLANACGSGKAIVGGMLDAFVREHRHLQQAGVRHFVGMLQDWTKRGTEAAMSDLRNKDSWDFAQEIVKLDPCFASI